MLRVAGVLLAALALTPAARALECPGLSIEDHIRRADVAFVGRLAAERPIEASGGIEQLLYRFAVDQEVKGDVGREVDVRAAVLVDTTGARLRRDDAVGVLASRVGGRLVTSSCSLVDPGALLSSADEPRGGVIKVVIGALILAVVLAYSLRRLRRRRESLAG